MSETGQVLHVGLDKNSKQELVLHHVKASWSSEEIALLQDMRGRVCVQDIAHLLGRTKASVSGMLQSLDRQDPSRPPPRKWTENEVAFVVKNHRILKNQHMADQLGRTKATVRAKIKDLRLSGQYGSPRRWTEVDDTYLLLSWQTDLLSEIATALGRTVAAIKNRVKSEHKIRRPPSYYVRIGQLHHLFPPELRELITLNRKLKKGLRDEEHRRSAGKSVL